MIKPFSASWWSYNKLFHVKDMMAYRWCKLYLHLFLTSAIVRGEWSVSRSDLFTSCERTTVNIWCDALGAIELLCTVYKTSCPPEIWNQESAARIHVTIPTTLIWWRRTTLSPNGSVAIFQGTWRKIPYSKWCKIVSIAYNCTSHRFLKYRLVTFHYQYKKQHYERCTSLIRISLACFIH